MEYRLICNGRLLPGADTERALAGLRELTGFSDERIHAKLLSGKRGKLKSSDDKAKLDALAERFRAVGLDVTVEPVPATPAKPPVGDKPRHRGVRIAIAVILLLVALVVGLVASGWYWLRAPVAAGVAQAVDALADGRLVAIGHVDVAKLTMLQRHWFGELDPKALPVADDTSDLLGRLLDGPPALRRNVEHALFALHERAEDAPGGPTWVLAGRFDREALLDTLAGHYQVVTSGVAGWPMLKARPHNDPMACPDDSRQRRGASPVFLTVTPDWLVLTGDLEEGRRLVRRLEAGAPAAQDLTPWRTYHEGKLASLMVMAPGEAGMALGGLPGMMAAKAAQKAEPLRSVAASLTVAPLRLGLQVNIALASADPAWTRDIVDRLRQGLDELKADSRRVSPTLASLLERVHASRSADSATIDVALDRQVLDQLRDVAREGIGSVFGVGMRDASPAGDQPDQIADNPVDYAASAALANLPALKLESYERQPLFQQGPFGVDLESIRRNDEGLLELRLLGLVGLPQGKAGFAPDRRADVTLAVDSVTDAAGDELLRDERCVERGAVVNGVRNHEPADYGQVLRDRAQIHKQLRLREGTRLEDIHRISGTLQLSAPVQVRQFRPALRAGESIEHGGMRLYIASVGERSVSYQVSGDTGRLLEVRGLNADGKTLRTGWRMSGDDDSRVTQQYEGRLASLVVFVAERVVDHRQPFELTDLFEVPPAEEKIRPKSYAPLGMDPQAWKAYESLPIADLPFDPGKLYTGSRDAKPIGVASWPAVKLFVTHTPVAWSNAPQALIYHPMLEQLPGVLSAFSYRIDEPAPKDGDAEQFVQVSYPYRSNTGAWVAAKELNGKPLAVRNISLRTGLADNARLERLKGKLTFRLPLETASHPLALTDLWQGVTVDGITVSLREVSRGMFPGYALQIEGDLTRLVNLHGLASDGRRVLAEPVNYQDAGYWTMTLPFGQGIEQVELVTASRQSVHEFPFDIEPASP